jgi:hypothetical protein
MKIKNIFKEILPAVLYQFFGGNILVGNYTLRFLRREPPIEEVHGI